MSKQGHVAPPRDGAIATVARLSRVPQSIAVAPWLPDEGLAGVIGVRSRFPNGCAEHGPLPFVEQVNETADSHEFFHSAMSRGLWLGRPDAPSGREAAR